MLLTGLKDHMNESAPDELIDMEYEFTKTVYSSMGCGDNLKISRDESNHDFESQLGWLFE